MQLQSALDLKRQLLESVVAPFTADINSVKAAGAAALSASRVARSMGAPMVMFGVGARAVEALPNVQRSIALGVAPYRKGFRLAIRLQRLSLRNSPIVEHLRAQAHGEVDMRIVGHIAKRAAPWYQRNTRPLLIGASIAHVKVTAGTLGAIVTRGDEVCVLSNNHVLANEDQSSPGDWIIQRSDFDGGVQPKDRVARLSHAVKLKKSGANFVDAALGILKAGIRYNPNRLRTIVAGKDRKLAGLGPEFVDEGQIVHKVGRTTGATTGRVTAFDLDNVVVSYDVGNLRFDGQIEIEGAGDVTFSDGGDSGSLIVNADMQAVALLFAGSDAGGANELGLTYANPIHRVLKDLKATLLH